MIGRGKERSFNPNIGPWVAVIEEVKDLPNMLTAGSFLNGLIWGGKKTIVCYKYIFVEFSNIQFCISVIVVDVVRADVVFEWAIFVAWIHEHV